MIKRFTRIGALLMSVMLMLSLLSGCGTKKSFDYQFSEPKSGETIAVFHTSMGDFTVRFFKDEAPKAVENFITLAQQGYYNGCEFYRVMEDFMIQSGDPTNTGVGGESIYGAEGFETEYAEYLSPYYGSLCMANYTNGTSAIGSQFFIVTTQNKDTETIRTFNEDMAKAERIPEEKLDMYDKVGGAMWLDYQIGTVYSNKYVYTASTYTVFGQVISGLEVVDAIGAVKTYNATQENEANILNPGQTIVQENRPVETVTITSIEITTY